MVSIFVPLGYISFLVISLLTFSKIYRKRSLRRNPSPPWFPTHSSRDIYYSLLSLDPPPPRPILVAALLKRAIEDVGRIWSIRDSKPSLNTLLTKGQIGDKLWEAFQEAEKELEKEIVEVVGEAETFEKGYGQKIFAVASDMITHQKWKDVYYGIEEKRKLELQKQSSYPPTPLLSPTSYLTPSSLTLFPSNPLSPHPPPPPPATLTTTRPTPTPSPAPPSSLPSTAAKLSLESSPSTSNLSPNVPPPPSLLSATPQPQPQSQSQITQVGGKTLRPEIAARLQALREASAAAAASVSASPASSLGKVPAGIAGGKGKKKKPVKGGK